MPLTLSQKVRLLTQEREAEADLAEAWAWVERKPGCVDAACALAVAYLSLECARADQGRFPDDPKPSHLLR
jgi:hypothetical protein